MEMSRSVAIRITADSDENLLEFAKQYPGIWCKEGPDLEKFCQKSHYHGIIHTTLTDNGLRKQIYNVFQTPVDNRGQRFVAFSKITDDKGGEDGFVRYICKGTEKLNPLILYNSFNYNIEEKYDAFWDIYSDLKQKGKEKREKKLTNKANFKEYFINKYVGTKGEEYIQNPDKVERNPIKIRLSKEKIAMLMYEFYLQNEWELPSPSQGEITIMDLYLRYCHLKDVKKEILEYWRLWGG